MIRRTTGVRVSAAISLIERCRASGSGGRTDTALLVLGITTHPLRGRRVWPMAGHGDVEIAKPK
jgi:hypothetical protein